MTTAANDSASTFAVTEQTGQQRAVKLQGRALPYRPFELSGTQRNSIEWYTGNPIGVLQVYGAKEEQTTITGMWKDTFLGDVNWAYVDDAPIRAASVLVDLFDSIRRQGQVVQVTWLDRSRTGLLERFTQKWHNAHDVEWEMMFSWISQSETLSDVPLASSSAYDVTDGPAQFQSLGTQVLSGVSGFSTAFAPAYQAVVDAINDAGNAIQDGADELNDMAAAASTIPQAPGDLARRMSGIYDGLKLDADELRDTYDRAADGGRLNLGGPFGQVLADRATMRGQGVVAQSLASAAAQNQRQAQQSITSIILAVFQARGGDDLRRVSQIYYGTPDGWRGLMLYNNLTDEALVTGQTVIVPQQLPQVQL